MINPKQPLFLLLCFALIVLTVASCYKPHYPLPNPNPERKIQYELFTESDDLTEDNHTILFSLFIEKADGRAVWDSSLAVMKIKDIPFLPNKLNRIV